jgi:hypothetical protein
MKNASLQNSLSPQEKLKDDFLLYVTALLGDGLKIMSKNLFVRRGCPVSEPPARPPRFTWRVDYESKICAEEKPKLRKFLEFRLV